MSRHLSLGTAMKLTLGTAIACVSLGTATAGPRSLERAMETTTEAVSLPDVVPGSIAARGCLQCPSIRMDVPETATFFVGKDPVTIKQLREFSLGRRYDMVIFYELERNVVRRIVVSGVLPKAN